MKRILFVDDEPNVLAGLRRMLRPMRTDWYMAFVESGHEALERMAEKPFDVVVSDMRMPGMDGAELLAEVAQRYPDTVRFVLSGQSDRETIFRALVPMHQFLSKPCDPAVLKNTVARAFALRTLLGGDSVKRGVANMSAMPAMPELYAELVKELRHPEASVASVARIIERDVGMTAKLLQCVNSAFLGIRQSVTSPLQAVSLLGLDAVKSMVLMTGVFSQVHETKLPAEFSLKRLWGHSLAVGASCHKIGKAEGMPEDRLGEAFTAGLLHDSGMLLLALNAPEKYGRLLARVQETGESVAEVEAAVLGATHAEVGAYLLGLWGLTDPIVEAVAFHHGPADCPGQDYSPLTLVHAANAFTRNIHHASNAPDPALLDTDYLAGVGATERLPAWREMCTAVMQAKEGE